VTSLGGHTQADPAAANATLSGAAALGVAGSIALLGMALVWRLRPRRPRPVAAGSDGDLYSSWKRDLDDIADLAALTADPAELRAARRRRRAFRTDALARRLSQALDQPRPDGA
jgi:hypothetical protein